ncbi:MAG: TonB-dependent receptor [Bacteroidales bacterium]
MSIKKLFNGLKVLLFLALLVFPLLLEAQQINLTLKDVTIKEALKGVTEQTGYKFVYSDALKEINSKVTVNITNATLENCLNKILANQNVVYKIEGKQVLLSSKEISVSAPKGKENAPISIKGKVIDKETGEPISFASIYVKENKSIGIETDLDGNYSLRASPNQTLVVSFIGYSTIEMPILGKTVINASLKSDNVMLNDVVVVGFGTQKRANLTGAVSTVDTKDLETRPLADLNQGLQGISPGLTIQYESGQLNSSPSINVRGTGTIIDGVASGGPLILVDGIPTSLNMVNPDDVESISVLKDAASASIYGARAAFGVVLITTKKGDNTEKIKFSYTGRMGWSNPTKLLQHMDPIDELNAIIGAADARGEESESWGAYHKITLPGVQRWVDKYKSQRDPMDLNMVYGEDWENVNGTTYFYRVWDVEKLMFGENVPNMSHSLNLSGKLGANSSIMASLGYNQKDGVMRDNPEDMSRYNATVNINTKLSKWLTADIRIMASRQDYKEPYNYMGSGFSGAGSNGYFGHIYRYGAYAPYGTYKGIGFGFAPSYLRNANYNKKRTDYLRLAVNLKAQITKDISLVGEYSIGSSYLNWKMNGGVLNLWRYQGAMVDPNGKPVPQGATPGSKNDAVKVVKSSEQTQVFNAYARYNKTFGRDHNVGAQLGVNTEWNEFERTYSARLSLLDNDKPEFALATGTQYSTDANRQLIPGHSKYAIAGVFLRLNYDYKGKYLVEFNARYDGSSKFPTDSQWGVFPSASIGWRVSEEKFMEKARKYVNNLKLRLSAGAIGNQNVMANAFEPLMLSSNAYWLGNNSSTQNSTYGLPALTSDALTWEKVTTYDIGLDFGLFNMFTFSGDIYQRNTNGMLARGEALPEVFGASAPLTNNGNLRTRGYELSLSFNKIINNNISLFASVGLSNAESIVTSWKSAGTLNALYEGMVIGEIWGLTSDRLLQTGDFTNGKMNAELPDQSLLQKGVFKFGPGDMLYKDVTGDGKITGGKGTIEDHGDLTRIGNNLPKYEYNFRLGGEIYGFDLSVLFQGVGKRDLWATGSDVFLPFQRGYYDLLYAHQADYWRPDNTDAHYTRLWRYFGVSDAFSGVSGSCNSVQQTRYLLNMSYLRLKNLTVGYTLPKHITSKIRIDKVRVYFSGENLFTIQDKKLPVDPEVTQTEHMIGRSFPLQRTLSIGLQVNF